jgi:hypothetical protein
MNQNTHDSNARDDFAGFEDFCARLDDENRMYDEMAAQYDATNGDGCYSDSLDSSIAHVI